MHMCGCLHEGVAVGDEVIGQEFRIEVDSMRMLTFLQVLDAVMWRVFTCLPPPAVCYSVVLVTVMVSSKHKVKMVLYRSTYMRDCCISQVVNM